MIKYLGVHMLHLHLAFIWYCSNSYYALQTLIVVTMKLCGSMKYMVQMLLNHAGSEEYMTAVQYCV